VIGLAVIKKQVVFKDIHKVIPIGQKRPRGQLVSKKTKGALEKQQHTENKFLKFFGSLYYF